MHSFLFNNSYICVHEWILGDFLMVEKPKENVLKPTLKKYLITWSLDLSRGELDTISQHPEVLNKGLKYIKSTSKRNPITIYRIGAMEEISRFVRPSRLISVESAHPNGIAIVEAKSIEDARKMIDLLVEGLGFGFGSVSVKNYLEYEIKPLIEVTSGGRQ
jgi:hypothetical protein